jgi:cation transport regulator ChaC
VKIAVFGYGSLISPESIGQTLGRITQSPLPARLQGWRRRWSLLRDNLRSEKTFARADGGELPPWVLGLNVEPDADADLAPNGALIEIDEAELQRLDLREIRYRRVEVTDRIEAEHDFKRVVTYTARPENFAAEPPDGAVAMAPYLRAVEAAFRELGEGEWERFLANTGPPPVELIEPRLVRDEIPPGNPRDW